MPTKKRLLVISPGLGLKTRDWEPLLRALRAAPGWGEDTTEILRHESGTKWWKSARLAQIGQDLSARIQARWVASGGFKEVVLVGHSTGGLLVREAFLRARGPNRAVPPILPWAGAVVRIVLVAAPNRGVAELEPWVRPIHWVLRRLRGLHLCPHMTYEDLMRGSAFISNLRIGWIRLFALSDKDGFLPEIVQLRGTVDPVVRADDSTDLLVFPGATFYDVPGARHRDTIRLDGLDPETARDRTALLCTAIRAPHQLRSIAAAVRPAPSTAQDVVIVLHGIRAERTDHWVSDVEAEVLRVFPPDTVVEKPTYGFLSAREFAVPTGRRRYLRNFQDIYTEALARHPSARFHFIGHSNGTFLLGRSLLDIPAMTFCNVVLAGSVLPPTYPWDDLLSSQQVMRVRSDRGQGDWPVGWLCAALRYGLFMRDVGPGGYVGFNRGIVQEELWHPGGHGGMLNNGNIPRMVRFARNLDPGTPLTTQGPDAPSFAVKGRLMKYGLWTLLASLAGIGIWLGISHQLTALGWYVLGVFATVLVLYVGLDVI